jgi:polyhydroxybutyrate depolymerase
VLHGGGGSGETYLDRAGWGAKANEAGFLAVAPDALPAMPRFAPNFLTNPRLWNTGQLKPQSPRSRIDDRAFFQSLLDDVARRWDIDPDRIYLTGHSNGAGMTFRLGAEMSERFAALAPVASHVWIDNPQPKHPRPTLYLIGTEDPLVPLAGGETTLPWGKRTTPPVSQTLQRWARAIGCDPEGKLRSDENGVKIVDYGPGRRGATLTAYFLSGHGHGWPGGSDVLPERLIGPSATSIKATDLIWEFFRDKTRSD